MIMRQWQRAMVAVLTAAFVAVGLAVSVARDASIGQEQVRLTWPTGFCEVDGDHSADIRLLRAVREGIAGRNLLVAMFADCRQLKDWRAGKRSLLDDVAHVQTLAKAVDVAVPLPSERAVQEVCAIQRLQAPPVPAGTEGEFKQRLDAAAATVKLNEARYLGLVAEDKRACYGALLQRTQAEGADKGDKAAKSEKVERLQAVVVATTVVKGKYVYHYLFTPYDGPKSMERLLERQRKNVAAFLAANPR